MHIIVTLEALDTFIVSLREKMSIGENSFLSIHAISWGVQKREYSFFDNIVV